MTVGGRCVNNVCGTWQMLLDVAVGRVPMMFLVANVAI